MAAESRSTLHSKQGRREEEKVLFTWPFLQHQLPEAFHQSPGHNTRAMGAGPMTCKRCEDEDPWGALTSRQWGRSNVGPCYNEIVC